MGEPAEVSELAEAGTGVVAETAALHDEGLAKGGARRTNSKTRHDRVAAQVHTPTSLVDFEALSLDGRLVRALRKRGIATATLVQQEAIPVLLKGINLICHARTGSGKTLAYLLPTLHTLLLDRKSYEAGLQAVVLVPTKELCEQVKRDLLELVKFLGGAVSAAAISTSTSKEAASTTLAALPMIVIATPGRLSKCLAEGSLSPNSLQKLRVLVLDEADLLISYGYEKDVASLAQHIPKLCQLIMMSATSARDELSKLSAILGCSEPPRVMSLVNHKLESGVAQEVKHYALECRKTDKLLFVLALLRLNLIPRKVLIFLNNVDFGVRLKLFLERFGIRSAVLNAELPVASRQHILQSFNAGLFDILIATDLAANTTVLKKRKRRQEEAALRREGQGLGLQGAVMEGIDEIDDTDDEDNGTRKPADADTSISKGPKKHEEEYGVVRGIDFKDVRTVLNVDMPVDSAAYQHRAGRTGRAGRDGQCVTLYTEKDRDMLERIRTTLKSKAKGKQQESAGDGSDEEAEGEEGNDGRSLSSLPGFTKAAVDALRYRAEDVARGITKAAVREARVAELRAELLHSEKLRSHFEDRPQELEALQHDKPLFKGAAMPHLKHLPGYLRHGAPGKGSEFASKRCTRRPGRGRKGKTSGPTKDPLKKSVSRMA